jgi:hypothetical protein
MDWLIRHTVYQRVTNSSVGRRCMRSGCGGSISLAFRSLSPPSFRNSSYGGFFSNKVVLSRSGSDRLLIFLASIRPLSEVLTDTRFQNSGVWGHRRSVSVPQVLPMALTDSTATIPRLATANQRHLRWPTDEMEKSVQSRH